MKIYAKAIEDRKELVKRLEELTRKKARYTFVPRCAFEIGDFTVEKDGCMTAADDADPLIIGILKNEGMIGAIVEEESSADALSEISMATETTEEWGDEDEEESPCSEPSAYENQSPEVWEPEEAEILPGNDTDMDDSMPSQSEGENSETDELLNASISFSLNAHTVQSLVNLICMIHSRGALLSKATGGTFFADKEMVDSILDEKTFRSVKELISYIREWGETSTPLMGISFEDDKLTFDGFGQAKDAEHVQTFMKLAAAMNKMAIMQKRVQAKDVDDSNEKYSLRVWLIRLGLNGAEFKADRKRLMAPLSGHTAFRNDEERERWEAKQLAKKEALKAFKAGREDQDDAVPE